MWRFIGGGLLVLLIAFGLGAAVRSDGDFGPDRWDDDRTARVVSADGTETVVQLDRGERVERIVHADGTESLVIRDGWGHGGFPFGILIVPLVIIGIVLLVRGLVGRGPGRWGGPGGPGGWGGPGFGYGGPPWAYVAPAGTAAAEPGPAPTGSGRPTGSTTAETDVRQADPTTQSEPPAWFQDWLRRVHASQPAAAEPDSPPASSVLPTPPQA